MMAHSSGRDSALTDVAAPAAAPEKASAGADPEKRRRILDAAIRTFGRRGFHEARIADIAADAKVAEGTVYLYFRNKEDLLGVVFDESMDDVLEKGRAVARSKAPAAERLTALLDLHFQFIGSDRDLASVFQIELRRSARLVERFSRSKLVEHFRILGFANDGRGGQKTGFDVTGKLNRKDFGVSWNAVVDQNTMLSDDVDLVISVEANKPAPKPAAPPAPAAAPAAPATK